MEEKEIKIIPPEGYEIDKENSTLECIKFKPKSIRWRDNENAIIEGYYIKSSDSELQSYKGGNTRLNNNLFAESRQAKSALAMARISQIMAHDKRFGGVITDEEWKEETPKYTIGRYKKRIIITFHHTTYQFLAFHTSEQRDLFIEENMDLIKDYFMLD